MQATQSQGKLELGRVELRLHGFYNTPDADKL